MTSEGIDCLGIRKISLSRGEDEKLLGFYVYIKYILEQILVNFSILSATLLRVGIVVSIN